jgi:hypothetical protein
MPVPLNAFVDVAKVWFTEVLGYLINDSVPVKPNYAKGATPSDIDLICKNPDKNLKKISFSDGRSISLKQNLLVECKGFFDYNKSEFFKLLMDDLKLLKEHQRIYLPKTLPSKSSYFFFLRQEVFDKGKQIFGSYDFQRVIIGPFMRAPRKSLYSEDTLIKEYENRKIIIIKMKDILENLFGFISDAKNAKKERNSENFNKLRKTYTLEMLHLVATYYPELLKRSNEKENT